MASTEDHRTHPNHPHKHQPGCGHVAVSHEGHTDYLHDGHLHHVAGDEVRGSAEIASQARRTRRRALRSTRAPSTMVDTGTDRPAGTKPFPMAITPTTSSAVTSTIHIQSTATTMGRFARAFASGYRSEETKPKRGACHSGGS